MKKILMRVSTMLSAAALLVGLTFVSSCNDTKDDVKKEEVKELPNCFSAADTTINIVSGEQMFIGSDGGQFGDNSNTFIVLYSEIDNTGKPTEESAFIALGFCIDKADTALLAGTYKYSETVPFPVGTLIPIGSGYSVDGVSDTLIVSGEVVVKLSEGIYEITFVGKDELGKEVKAYYKGKLKWVDKRKDEVDTNCFSAADTTINIVSGVQVFYGSGEPYGDNNRIQIVLESKVDNPGESTEESGGEESGGVSLDFCVGKANTALLAGTYKYSAAQPYVAGTLTPESCYLIYRNVFIIVSGEAVVKLSGEIYEITFVGKDKLDKEVKAYYKGKLESY